MDVEKHSRVHFADPTCDAHNDPGREAGRVPLFQFHNDEKLKLREITLSVELVKKKKKKIETIQILKLLTQNSFYCLMSRIMKEMSTQPALILRSNTVSLHFLWKFQSSKGSRMVRGVYCMALMGLS